jgi:FKBP-type peptidyl-prolyl cis-trans isomerase SlpA
MNRSTATVENGSRVKLKFTLLLSDGTVVEGTTGDQPLTITIGQSDLLPAFEQCLIGLKPGDKERFEIDCTEAFGPVDEDNVHALPRKDFPPEMELGEGSIVGFTLPDGREVAGTIVGVNEHEVQVNFSHPLAGRDVVFDVEIMEVSGAAAGS